ncbi:MAG: HIT family protein [Sedimentisphaeraceae bacterium JB056]
MADCIFCKIAAGEIPCTKIYEDDDILSFMDINPISEGHTLVITKGHYKYAHQCPPELMAKLAAKLPMIAEAVFQVSGADGYNILCNSGKASGQEVPHLHFHIIPRFEGDGVLANWPAGKYDSMDKMKDVCNKIRQKLA